MTPAGPVSPGFLQGTLSAPFTGIAEGAVGVGESIMSGATDLAAEGLRDIQGAAGGNRPGVPIPESATTLFERSPDAIEHDRAVASQAAVDQYKSDPATNGTAAQVIHGIFSVGTRAAIGGLAGPEGAAIVAGGTSGALTNESLQLQGVDANTAHTMAIADALMTGAAVGTPLLSGVGKQLTTRLLSGAGVNAVFGAANRATMHGVLDANGYDAMAEQYRVLDGRKRWPPTPSLEPPSRGPSPTSTDRPHLP